MDQRSAKIHPKVAGMIGQKEVFLVGLTKAEMMMKRMEQRAAELKEQ